MTTEKDKILSKIEALLSKTVENGATEAEALMAAEKASELMAKHDIAMGEIGVAKSDCLQAVAVWERYAKKRIGEGFLFSLSRLCDCKAWYTESGVTFFGFKADVAVAKYLFAHLSRSVMAGLKAYRNTADFHLAKAFGTHGKTLCSSFIAGMESRLSARLCEMKLERTRATVAEAGQALVVVKEGRIQEELAKLNLRFKPATKRTNVRSSHGFYAGQAAGDRVSIHSAVTA